jgi:hypothetical protein
MRTTQEKFLRCLDERGNGYDLELVVSYDYSNRGSAEFQPTGAFDAVVTFKFDFQASGSVFEIGDDFVASGEKARFYCTSAESYQAALDAIWRAAGREMARDA